MLLTFRIVTVGSRSALSSGNVQVDPAQKRNVASHLRAHGLHLILTEVAQIPRASSGQAPTDTLAMVSSFVMEICSVGAATALPAIQQI
jgi:hypothetical protein